MASVIFETVVHEKKKKKNFTSCNMHHSVVILFLAFIHNWLNIPVYGFIMTVSISVQSCVCLWVTGWAVFVCLSSHPLWSGQNTGRGVKKDKKSPNYWPEMRECVFAERLRNTAEFETINVPWTSSFLMRSSTQRQYKHTKSRPYEVMTQVSRRVELTCMFFLVVKICSHLPFSVNYIGRLTSWILLCLFEHF